VTWSLLVEEVVLASPLSFATYIRSTQLAEASVGIQIISKQKKKKEAKKESLSFLVYGTK
jgi:hypothetical protein